MKYTEPQLHKSLLWLQGELSTTEAAKALKISHSRNVYSKMAALLREAYRRGKLKTTV